MDVKTGRLSYNTPRMTNELTTPAIAPEVAQILSLFEMISSVPRPSGREERVREKIREWASGNGLDTQIDGSGNLLVRVPAAAGCGHAPIVVLQGHLDMVCEKRSGSDHRFDTDPILPLRNGDWVRAVDTTLGADNGIGVALALAAALPSVCAVHPELELLFTVDEEKGLRGASGLDRSLLKGRILINLDSESDGTVTIGCAGGTGVVTSLSAPAGAVRPERQAEQSGAELFVRLTVGGLVGGHSGTDIHRGRASANALLGRLLCGFTVASSFRLARMDGGSAHNAIAREATAEFVISEQDYARCRRRVSRCADTIRRTHRETDPDLCIEFSRFRGSDNHDLPDERRPPSEEPPPTAAQADAPLRSHASSVLAVRLLAALPHGVYGSETGSGAGAMASSNVAVVASGDSGIDIVSSLRSHSVVRLKELTALHRSIAVGNGADVRSEGSYPGWDSDPDSGLVQRCRQLYRGLFRSEPAVEVVHAGLECGVIAQAYPTMQMVSLGPTILDAHTPDERLNLPSLERTWRFLSGILASYCSSAGNSSR